jgi:hypothetical protein
MTTVITPPSAAGTDTRRRYFWFGLAAPFVGIAIYALQFRAGILKLPWYLPILGTVGVALIVYALLRKRSVWRFAGLTIVAILAFMQWFLVAGGLRLPAYAGPVAAGKAFPAFSATFADGSAFTPESFKGHNTALVFFRGRW